MFAVTGATGQLGRLVIQQLSRTVAPDQIVACVRDPRKAADLTALGVQVRQADYARPETLAEAFRGVTRLLLISSNEVGGRLPQHEAVIAAAKAEDVSLLAYTSILHAETSPAKLAHEHKATEAVIAASGLPAVLLRNGWYTENYLMALQPILEHGALLGAAREGRISVASRADYAAAAAVALTADGQAGKVYELAGDTGWTLAAFAGEIGRQAGKPVVYRDMPQADYKAVLISVGLPEPLADLLADADARAADGALFEDGHALSRLIGRPTTPAPETIAAALSHR